MHNNYINGIILLDKASGISSHKALQQVKHLLAAKKAGHTGSLDPLATGILPLCFGEATKFASYLLAEHKTYVATAKLGQTTTTLDSEGDITNTSSVAHITTQQVLQVLRQYTGEITQIPPMYSALKVGGTALYKLARAGKEIIRKERQCTVYSLELLDFKEDILTFQTQVSKGTYIRTLAADIGTSLGCGAHLISLRRIGFGEFSIAQTSTFRALSQQQAPLDKLLSPLAVMKHIKSIILTTQQLDELRFGRVIAYTPDTITLSHTLKPLPLGTLVTLVYNHTFIGLGVVADGCIKPKRLINFNVFDAANIKKPAC